MQQAGSVISSNGIEQQGVSNAEAVFWNLDTPSLYEHAICSEEGQIAKSGPLVVLTGTHTGRSANDKFIVRDETTENTIAWGKVNKPFDPAKFTALHQRVLSYLQGQTLYVQDCWGGASAQHRLGVRVITETAWHSLFIRNLLIQPTTEELGNFDPEFTIIHTPNFQASPEIDDTNSEVFVLADFTRKLVLIGGTSYAGEIKKSVFSLLNYLLPAKGVMPMHCSVNVGEEGDAAVFFGLSGTGKTTLSADPHRTLIGDDEHGWGDDGLFNFEGGCYAKMIRLSEEDEPEIFATTRRFGTVLENVLFHEGTRELDLDNASLTENTRGAYPLSFIPNASKTGMAGNPKNIIMLTADAFGVLPPISKLTAEQGMYHFLSGYTAKVAGTEKGLGKDPEATFSTCFGAPFMPRHPSVYGNLLRDLIDRHKVDCWLVNTGWTGGAHGVGERMSLPYTRALLRAALDGSLAGVAMVVDPHFGLAVPQSCPGVPGNVLNPRESWADKNAYDAQASDLVARFIDNFAQFEDYVDDKIKAAAPSAA